MGKKIKFTNKVKTNTAIIDRVEETDFPYTEYVRLYDVFMKDKELEGASERTLEDYRLHLKYFDTFWKQYRFEQNRQVELSVFKNYIYYMMEEKQYSRYTVNIRLRTIKCYLRWLYNNDYIKENLTMKISLVKVPQDMCQPLSDDDIRIVLNSIDISEYHGFRDFTAIILIMDTGIRIGEMVQLKIADINLKESLITVRAEVSKTRTMRYLPISSKTGRLLKELIDCSVENNTDFIFQSTYGNQIKKQNMLESFRKIGERSGIKKRFTPYVLRHTFATNAVKAGIMDLFTLQRIMGHASLVTTRKYIQLDTEDLKRKHKQASPVDKFFKGGK